MSTEIKNNTTRKQVYDEDEFDLPIAKKARETEQGSDTSSETNGENNDDRLQRMAGAMKTILEVSTNILVYVYLKVSYLHYDVWFCSAWVKMLSVKV